MNNAIKTAEEKIEKLKLLIRAYDVAREYFTEDYFIGEVHKIVNDD